MRLMLGDCLEKMKEIEDGSVDLVLVDLPYGTTDCKWDSIVPFGPMWEQIGCVLKKGGGAIFTATQPFASQLIQSNLSMFKYEMVWWKPKATGFFNAKFQPLRAHELILLFSNAKVTYNPIMSVADPANVDRRKTLNASVLKDGIYSREGRRNKTNARKPDNGLRYPQSVIEFKGETKAVHPTQKPVALMEYLIRTYSNEGETVLDFTMGSGTTGVACVNTNRKFIGIERDETYFKIASERIEEAMKPKEDLSGFI